jgi:hypothetical protein
MIFRRKKNPQPIHVKGIHKGEETALHKGIEPGRNEGKDYRSSRDSTGINARNRKPILPMMPNIPPA